MKIFKKAVSLFMSGVLAFSSAAALSSEVFAANDFVGNIEFSISNPYEDVNFNTWKPYRGATHVHTVRSDGNVEVDDMIEDYYAHGYQALALTDHGTVNYSWVEKQSRLVIFDYQYFVHGAVDTLSKTRYQQITTGSDRGGDGMTEIPLGIELNGSSTAKCHVNSYYADCGHGDLELTATWPEDAVKKCEKAGGICHINHVGEWTDGKDDINTYDSDFVKDFSNLFLNYQSCIGMELVNTKDNRTHNDRYLYDETLKICAKEGVPIWGFCEDDSHDPEDVANNAQFFMLPENNAANIRTCMEKGQFFACSKNSKNSWELGDGFNATGDFPMVSNIEVDDKTDQISITAYNASKITMVADGNVLVQENIPTTDNNTITFDLNRYENNINSYVRFYITGQGGICYIQPFLLTKGDHQESVISFDLPSTNSYIVLTNSKGEIVQPINSTNVFKAYADTFTYRVTRNGYIPKTGTFTVTEDDIAQAKQFKFKIEMEIDTSGADYTEVNALVNEYKNLTESQYTSSTWYALRQAVNSVDYTLQIKDQDIVDGYANDIQEKMDALTFLVKPLYPKEGSKTVIDEENKIIYGVATELDSLKDYVCARPTFEYVCHNFGTGSKVAVTNGKIVLDEYTLVVFGDLTGDSKIDATDAIVMDCYDNNIYQGIEDCFIMAMDCNHDDAINKSDYNLLKKSGLSDVDIKQEDTTK